MDVGFEKKVIGHRARWDKKEEKLLLQTVNKCIKKYKYENVGKIDFTLIANKMSTGRTPAAYKCRYNAIVARNNNKHNVNKNSNKNTIDNTSKITNTSTNEEIKQRKLRNALSARKSRKKIKQETQTLQHEIISFYQASQTLTDIFLDQVTSFVIFLFFVTAMIV